MGILDSLLSRVINANNDLSGTIRDVVSRHGEDILEMQRAQLLDGMSSSGEDLRPYYSEDLQPGGYFKTREDASRYAAWKGDISPYSARRNPDAPNLYINGKFHSELDVEFGSDTVSVIGGTAYAKGIINKYGFSSFGLTGENWGRLFTERGAYDELMTTLRQQLYGN